ncbi:uncharacterized protein MONBRDRAFT_31218 [Monosiga brevicollis MX1]|uniref:guanylate cyclase n=1 Tax=Monosiga brevicollis TaxID=81824 RepID=A9USG1_MONBE|nr:uncharacterized protein MONBRDRAFT_31218 [Monosiga brevicollis MX1]EDQ91774.1 predicted protein [Monosiga brevicollis MX1]|eukprot:XP_001743060.1 hypothetical protein [Monosiga brevicollis MX1]
MRAARHARIWLGIQSLLLALLCALPAGTTALSLLVHTSVPCVEKAAVINRLEAVFGSRLTFACTNSPSRAMEARANNEYDFLWMNHFHAACAVAELDWEPFMALNKTAPYRTARQGYSLWRLANRTFTDTGGSFSVGTMQASYFAMIELLNQMGSSTYLLDAPVQSQYYSDINVVFEALSSGALDFAVIPACLAEEAGIDVSPFALHVANGTFADLYAGCAVSFGFEDEYDQIIVNNRVPSSDVAAIFDVFNATTFFTNNISYNWVDAALAVDYTREQVSQLEKAFIKATDSGMTCLLDGHPDYLHCGGGLQGLPAKLEERVCLNMELECPVSAASCFCHFCLNSSSLPGYVANSSIAQDDPLQYVSQVLSGNTHCREQEICAEFVAGSNVALYLVDLEASSTPTTPSVRMRMTTTPSAEAPVWMPATVIDPGVGLYSVTLANATSPGVLVVDVRGQETTTSFWFTVLPMPCKGELEVRVADGSCGCAGHAVLLGNSCHETWKVTLGFVLGSVALLAMLLVIFAYVARWHNDRKWQVHREDLIFTNPPTRIGVGRLGPAFKAEYHSMDVVVKALNPSNSHRGTGHTLTRPITPGNGASTIRRRNSRRRADTVYAKVPQPLRRHESLTANHSNLSTLSSSEEYDVEDGKQNLQLLAGGRVKSYFANADFRSRMRMLVRLKHPNVITTFGISIDTFSPFVVLEYMENQSVYQLLHKSRTPFSSETLMSMMRNVVDGMCYLHGHDPVIVHGHLTSKNVLVDSNLRCKVSDFLGMCDTRCLVHEQDAALAPEARRGVLIPACDVYAWAVMTWESFTRIPLRTTDYETVGRHFNESLTAPADDSDEDDIDGNYAWDRATRFKKAFGADPLALSIPSDIRKLLHDCSKENPHERLVFKDVQTRLKTFSMRSVGAALVQLGEEGHRQARVLQQVFPKHVADALKAGVKPEIEEMENVSVFFTDICGFTTISSKLSAAQVSDMLDRFFSRLDILIKDLDLYKVDVIGDCVIVAGNLYRHQEDHVSRLCRFALGALKAAEETPILVGSNYGPVRIRCGIHVGPVVCNVIGKISPKYTLLGDTMNTASRMESSSLPGYAQLTSEAATMLTEQDAVIASRLALRGAIPVKGKGELITYWLLRPKQEAPMTDQLAEGLPTRSDPEVLAKASATPPSPNALDQRHRSLSDAEGSKSRLAPRGSWSGPETPFHRRSNAQLTPEPHGIVRKISPRASSRIKRARGMTVHLMDNASEMGSMAPSTRGSSIDFDMFDRCSPLPHASASYTPPSAGLGSHDSANSDLRQLHWDWRHDSNASSSGAARRRFSDLPRSRRGTTSAHRPSLLTHTMDTVGEEEEPRPNNMSAGSQVPRQRNNSRYTESEGSSVYERRETVTAPEARRSTEFEMPDFDLGLSHDRRSSSSLNNLSWSMPRPNRTFRGLTLTNGSIGDTAEAHVWPPPSRIQKMLSQQGPSAQPSALASPSTSSHKIGSRGSSREKGIARRARGRSVNMQMMDLLLQARASGTLSSSEALCAKLLRDSSSKRKNRFNFRIRES